MDSLTENATEWKPDYVIEGDTADLAGIEAGHKVEWDSRRYVMGGDGHLERIG